MPETVTSPNLLFDRRFVRLRRDRAAAGFGSHDFLLRHVLEDFRERLTNLPEPVLEQGFERALVLGSHGLSAQEIFGSRQGVGQIVPASTFLCDHSEAMVRLGVQKGVTGQTAVMDEEWVPFAEESFDLILAPLSLHFVNDLPGVLAQLRRTLRPGGLFLTAFFGGESLSELREVLQKAEIEVDGGLSPRVIPFTDVKDLGALLQRVGFFEPVSDLDRVPVHYQSFGRLLDDLRGMGLSNPMKERRKGPFTRMLLARAGDLYQEMFGSQEGLMASYHLVYGTGWVARS